MALTNPAEAAQNMIAMVEIVGETIVGYHKKLVDGGVPTDIAGQMAIEFHSMMMQSIARGQQPKR